MTFSFHKHCAESKAQSSTMCCSVVIIVVEGKSDCSEMVAKMINNKGLDLGYRWIKEQIPLFAYLNHLKPYNTLLKLLFYLGH